MAFVPVLLGTRAIRCLFFYENLTSNFQVLAKLIDGRLSFVLLQSRSNVYYSSGRFGCYWSCLLYFKGNITHFILFLVLRSLG